MLPGTDGAQKLSWSPDGSLIAFERGRDYGPAELVVVDPNSGTTRTLASGYYVNQGMIRPRVKGFFENLRDFHPCQYMYIDGAPYKGK